MFKIIAISFFTLLNLPNMVLAAPLDEVARDLAKEGYYVFKKEEDNGKVWLNIFSFHSQHIRQQCSAQLENTQLIIYSGNGYIPGYPFGFYGIRSNKVEYSGEQDSEIVVNTIKEYISSLQVDVDGNRAESSRRYFDNPYLDYKLELTRSEGWFTPSQ
jgi:hypothetical protein